MESKTTYSIYFLPTLEEIEKEREYGIKTYSGYCYTDTFTQLEAESKYYNLCLESLKQSPAMDIKDAEGRIAIVKEEIHRTGNFKYENISTEIKISTIVKIYENLEEFMDYMKNET